MHLVSAFNWLRVHMARVRRASLETLAKPASGRQMPALVRRTRHSPAQTTLRRGR
jgi:hypothetical protein